MWLASWYPNPVNPFDGDFIQRHARAASLYNQVTVFYVSQAGVNNEIAENKTIERTNEGVEEKIFFFYFKKTGLVYVDKLIYNWRYYNTYKKAIKNYFFKEGKPDIIHVHVPMKAGMIARWIRKRWAIPYIVSEHSAHYKMRTDDDFLSKSIIHKWVVKKIFRGAVAITNVSEALGKKIAELFKLRNIRIIYNTVDTRLFNYKKTDDFRFRFIHVSTLHEHQKNVGGILRATAALTKLRHDFELVIVGPVSDEFRKIVEKLNLPPLVKFTGEIAYMEVARQMKQASAFVLFSRYENFPCVIIEALCCGLPVIATDVGGVKEAINEGNGILIQSENEDELTRAMNKMIEGNNKFDRYKIAMEAKNKFSYSAIGRQFNNLYKEILMIND